MSEDQHKKQRIAKQIAHAGICSRREAERLIEAGKVSVNGKTIASPALNVSDSDEIIVNGKTIETNQQTRLFLYHKPTGLVTSHKDEKGRATVFENLPGHMPRVVSVGRLDMNTEGLLLLTNDGELSRFLELPANAWKRRYRVRVHGKIEERNLEKLRKGITVEGIKYKPIDITIDESTAEKSGHNSWLSITITEGKNREVRRVLDAIGLTVNRLIRTDYGPFTLGNLERNNISEIKTAVLKKQVPGFFKK